MTFIRAFHAPAALKPLALATLFVTTSSVLAQTQQQSLKQTEQTLLPIVVTASRTEQSQADALPNTSVITAEEIKNSQAVDLPTLLKREAGIQLTQNGGVGSTGGLFLRGTESRQTLVLIDGVPLTKQDASGTVSLEHLMLDQIERIEIVRGNVSAIYGSGAVGGVVQVFTKRGNGAPQTSLTMEAGSRNTYRVSAAVQGQSESKTRFSFAVSQFASDGFSSINSQQQSSANPDKDGYRNGSVSGAISQEWSKDQEFGVRFFHTDGTTDFDSSFGSPTDVHLTKSSVQTTTVFSNNRLSADWNSKLAYSQMYDKSKSNYNTSFGITNDSYTTDTDQILWTNELKLNPNWLLTGGLEHQQQAVSVDDGYGGLYNPSRTLNATFLGIQGNAGQRNEHQVQLNIRHDDLTDFGSANTAYAGYGYAVTPSFKMIASASSAFNAPPLGYLFAPIYGNPNLQAERARSVEIGAQYHVGRQLLRSTLFRSRISDQIDYDFTTSTFQNVKHVRNQGLELTYSGVLANTDVRSSLIVQNPIDEDANTRLRRRARTLLSLGASKAYGPWRIGADMQYTSARQDGAQQLDAYPLINTNVRYTVNKEVSVFGKIDNLFNRDYQTAYGFNQTPRGVFVGVNWMPAVR